MRASDKVKDFPMSIRCELRVFYRWLDCRGSRKVLHYGTYNVTVRIHIEQQKRLCQLLGGTRKSKPERSYHSNILINLFGFTTPTKAVWWDKVRLNCKSSYPISDLCIACGIGSINAVKRVSGNLDEIQMGGLTKSRVETQMVRNL